MGLIEEEMKQIVMKAREKAYRTAEPVLEVKAYEQGYWTGYIMALNDILAELDKPMTTPCEYNGMGF